MKRTEHTPPTRDRRASQAFTLLELMVVVGMLGIIMSAAFSGIGHAKGQARAAKANAEVRELLGAWLAYESSYDDWPAQVSGGELDATASALKELLGENDTQTVYLNAQMVRGAFRDPWGTPYRFRILERSNESKVTETFGASVTFPNRHRRQAQ